MNNPIHISHNQKEREDNTHLWVFDKISSLGCVCAWYPCQIAKCQHKAKAFNDDIHGCKKSRLCEIVHLNINSKDNITSYIMESQTEKKKALKQTRDLQTSVCTVTEKYCAIQKCIEKIYTSAKKLSMT